MVIGNGFFTDTRQDAVKEMQERSHCRVEHCPFPTIGNIDYYISEKGDLYGMQNIQGKQLTRLKKSVKYKSGYSARLQESPRREAWVPLQVLVYCAFTLKRWEPTVQLDFKNGNPYDVRPDNLMEYREEIPKEWSERLGEFADIYSQNFNRVAELVKWFSGISKEDAKDLTQATFVWLCTNGYKGQVNISLWIYWAKRRAQDFWKHHARRYNTADYDTILELKGRRDQAVEVDLFHIQKGEVRSRNLTLWAQGYTPTEIAEMTGSTTGNVSSSVTRSIQFLRKYFRHEKEMLRN